MRRPIILVVAAIALIAGLAVSVTYWRHGTSWAQSARTGAPPATPARSARVPVETAIAQLGVATSDIVAVGSLQSDESVKIAPEIAGRIAEITFKEGEKVNEDDVLVKLDEALTQAEVDEAEARFNLAKSNFDRATTLARSGTGTERARDEAVAALETGRVALELARVRLSKHTIKAPFPGTVGLRATSVGAFVPVGTAIVNLEKIDTLKLDFKVPEIFLSQVAVGQRVEVTVDALPNRKFSGSIYAIDPMVDVNGRALQIRARLPNADGTLRPGLFARITITGPKEEKVVLVPESALVPRGGENFVYTIEGEKATEIKVRLGQRKAGQVEVLEGLAAEATVVTAGHQRLRNGAAVEVITSDARARG